jgi:nucleotide-binding universal stress UspA family protein
MSIFDRVVVPIASEEDARATATVLGSELGPASEVTVVHVVEDVEGAPDPTPASHLIEDAQEYFRVFQEALGRGEDTVSSEVRHEPDVAEAILDVAEQVDATAVAFTPRGGNRWIKLLAGDVTTSLVEKSTIPLVILPDAEG